MRASAATATNVHKDLRPLAKELEDRGCTFMTRRNATCLDVVDSKGHRTGITLASTASRSAESPRLARQRLLRAGVLTDELADRREKRVTTVGEAFDRAAEAAGHRKMTEVEVLARVGLGKDPETPDRSPRKPKDTGILRPYRGKSPSPSMRYIGNAAWGDHVVRRVQKHLGEFSTKRDFVAFAIEVAKDRHLPPPNTRRNAKAKPWDVVRITDIMDHLIARRNARSLTLQFFSAVCDELEGVPGGTYTVKRNGDEEVVETLDAETADKVIGVKVFVDEDDDASRSVRRPSSEVTPEATRVPEESPDTLGTGDLRLRLARVLVERMETGEEVDEALVDRIERLIGQ